MNSILSKISAEYQHLTPTQRKIAEFLSHHLNDVLVLNVTQLAEKARVSEATISRLITRLGFAGFSEFKREIGRLIVQDISTTQKLSESAETFESSRSVLSEILRGDIENIRTITADISDALFEKVVAKLSSARSIYVLGLRASYALSLYLAFNLRFFLKSVNLLKPGIGDIPEQILDIGKKDVLIAISFKRYTREVVNIAEKAKEKGAYLVAITNNQLSPIGQLANKALIVKTVIPTYIESYTAPMSLINALITAIALRKKKQAMPALNRLEKEFAKFGTYTA